MKFISPKHRTLSSFACGVMLFTLLMTSCGSTTDPARTVTIPAAPTFIGALSSDSTAVRLIWKASTSESIVTNYSILVSGGVNTTVTVPKKTVLGDSTYIADVSGLRAGVSYTFAIRARTADTLSAAVTTVWSPALRLRGRVYESASGFASGIGFQNGAVQARRIGNPSEAALADFAIATPADSVYFGTPRTLYPITTARATTIDTTGFYRGIDSLNQVFEGMLNPNVFRQGFYRVRNMNPGGQPRGLVLYTRTAEGNFAKIFLRAVNGVLLQGNAPDRFVDLEISYQPTANLGYTLLTKASPDGGIQSTAQTGPQSPLWVRAPFISTPQNFQVSAAQK